MLISWTTGGDPSAASITRFLKRIGSLPGIMAEPHRIAGGGASPVPARAPNSFQRSRNDFLIGGSSLPALLPRGYLFRTRGSVSHTARKLVQGADNASSELR